MSKERVIELQLVVEMCPTCNGSGMARTTTWGVDNTDVESYIDVCPNCDGVRYWGAHYLEVQVA